MAEQRRGRRIALSEAELDEFLSAERTCRVATTGPDGPHLTALWFLWHDKTLWLTSITRAKRWAQLKRDPQVSVLVDAGHDYGELRGAELGDVEFVGEARGPAKTCLSWWNRRSCSPASTSAATRCSTTAGTGGYG